MSKDNANPKIVKIGDGFDKTRGFQKPTSSTNNTPPPPPAQTPKK